MGKKERGDEERVYIIYEAIVIGDSASAQSSTRQNTARSSERKRVRPRLANHLPVYTH